MKCAANDRDFDINIDGVAHYGLLPDFVEDLRNIGLTDADIVPLFSSAEHRDCGGFDPFARIMRSMYRPVTPALPSPRTLSWATCRRLPLRLNAGGGGKTST